MDNIHAGRIMDKVDGYIRHCETALHNRDCPYLAFGCLGCTFKPLVSLSSMSKYTQAVAQSLSQVKMDFDGRA